MAGWKIVPKYLMSNVPSNQTTHKNYCMRLNCNKSSLNALSVAGKCFYLLYCRSLPYVSTNRINTMRKNTKPAADPSKQSTQRRYHWKEFEKFTVLSCKFCPSFLMYIHRHRKRIILYTANFDLLIWYIDFKIGTRYLLFILSKSNRVSQQASRTLSQIVNRICYNLCEKTWNCRWATQIQHSVQPF